MPRRFQSQAGGFSTGIFIMGGHIPQLHEIPPSDTLAGSPPLELRWWFRRQCGLIPIILKSLTKSMHRVFVVWQSSSSGTAEDSRFLTFCTALTNALRPRNILVETVKSHEDRMQQENFGSRVLDILSKRRTTDGGKIDLFVACLFEDCRPADQAGNVSEEIGLILGIHSDSDLLVFHERDVNPPLKCLEYVQQFEFSGIGNETKMAEEAAEKIYSRLNPSTSSEPPPFRVLLIDNGGTSGTPPWNSRDVAERFQSQFTTAPRSVNVGGINRRVELVVLSEAISATSDSDATAPNSLMRLKSVCNRSDLALVIVGPDERLVSECSQCQFASGFWRGRARAFQVQVPTHEHSPDFGFSVNEGAKPPSNLDGAKIVLKPKVDAHASQHAFEEEVDKCCTPLCDWIANATKGWGAARAPARTNGHIRVAKEFKSFHNWDFPSLTESGPVSGRVPNDLLPSSLVIMGQSAAVLRQQECLWDAVAALGTYVHELKFTFRDVTSKSRKKAMNVMGSLTSSSFTLLRESLEKLALALQQITGDAELTRRVSKSDKKCILSRLLTNVQEQLQIFNDAIGSPPIPDRDALCSCIRGIPLTFLKDLQAILEAVSKDMSEQFARAFSLGEDEVNPRGLLEQTREVASKIQAGKEALA